MTKPDYNSRIALRVSAGAGLIGLAVVGAIIAAPNETFNIIDKVPIKLGLILNLIAFVAYLAWLAYDLFRRLPAWKMYRRAIRLVTGVGVLITLGPPGLFGLEKAVLRLNPASAGESYVPSVTLEFAIGGGVLGFLVMAAFITVLSWLYDRCEQRRLVSPAAI